MRRTQLNREIRSKLTEALEAASTDWVSGSFVAVLTEDPMTLVGFAHDRDGQPKPVTCDPSAVLDLLVALRDTMATTEHGPRWRSAFIRLDRVTGEINLEFEYNHPGRWARWPRAFKPSNPRAEG
jgi:hypothetical protein